MLRWKMLGLSSLLTAVLAVVPVLADPPPQGKSRTDAEKLDEYIKDVNSALEKLRVSQADINAIKSKVEEIGVLKVKLEELNVIKSKIEALEKRLDLHIQVNQRDTDRINERLKKVEIDLEAFKTQMSTSNRVSNYPGPAGDAGTIRLRNTFPDEVSIIVNGSEYRLLPNETHDLLNLPPGPFTYEVRRIQPPKTVTLAPKETFTITVFPR